jgi:hypothetical protein
MFLSAQKEGVSLAVDGTDPDDLAAAIDVSGLNHNPTRIGGDQTAEVSRDAPPPYDGV